MGDHLDHLDHLGRSSADRRREFEGGGHAPATHLPGATTLRTARGLTGRRSHGQGDHGPYMGNVDHLDHLDRIQEEFEGGDCTQRPPSQPRGTGGLEPPRKVITAPYIGMLITLIILAGLGRYLQRNSRGGWPRTRLKRAAS